MNTNKQKITITHLDITPLDPEWPNLSLLEFRQWVDDLIDDLPVSPQSVRFEISATDENYDEEFAPRIKVQYDRLESDDEYRERVEEEASNQLIQTQLELIQLRQLREKYKDWDGGFPL